MSELGKKLIGIASSVDELLDNVKSHGADIKQRAGDIAKQLDEVKKELLGGGADAEEDKT